MKDTLLILKGISLKFIILFGIICFIAGMTLTNEGSPTGLSISLVGIITAFLAVILGFGKTLRNHLTKISFHLSDRNKRHWIMAFFTFSINFVAIPFLALMSSWEIAEFLLILERVGMGFLGNPSKDGKFSNAAKQIGRSWVGELSDSLDEIGTLLGPLAIAAILYLKKSYQLGFGSLLVPAILALLVLAFVRLSYQKPQQEEVLKLSHSTKGNTKRYWLYLLAVGLGIAGYADFDLIAYHFPKDSILTPAWIPLLYSIVLGIDSLSWVAMEKLLDTKGVSILAIVSAIASFFAPLMFFGNFVCAFIGMILWGIGMGAQRTIMRTVIAKLIPSNKRAIAYGLLNLSFGIFWALGTTITDLSFDISLVYLVGISIFAQIAFIPLFITRKFKINEAR